MRKDPQSGSGNPFNDVEKGLRTLFRLIGEDDKREGLQDTPKRFVKSMMEMTKGYDVDISKIFTTFEKDGYNQMVTLRNISFSSMCEHHLRIFTGHCSVSYIPNKRIVGISKLARVVDAFAKRLQVQERLTQQVADTLWDHLKPLGVGVKLVSTHGCVAHRGVGKLGAEMVTTALKGKFLTDPSVKSEFLNTL